MRRSAGDSCAAASGVRGRDAGVSRLLAASLHQGIADVLPARLEFYENWLSSEGLREGTIGLAPFYAVLSFLRQEGDAYQLITIRAGEYAAEWTVSSMSVMRRKAIKAMPGWLRRRWLLRVVRDLVRCSNRESRAVAKVRRGIARIDLSGSIFCGVREPVEDPLCGFYAAAFTRLYLLFDLRERAEVMACRGMGEPQCAFTISRLDALEINHAADGA